MAPARLVGRPRPDRRVPVPHHTTQPIGQPTLNHSKPNNHPGLVPSTVLYSLSDTIRDATKTDLEAGAFTAKGF